MSHQLRDFMYLDTAKAEMLIGQLHEDGSAKMRVRTTTATHKNSSNFGVKAGFAGVGANVASGLEGNTGETDALHLDLQWVNLKELVDVAVTANTKGKDIDVHQLVHLVGEVSLHDVSIPKRIALDDSFIGYVRDQSPIAYETFLTQDMVTMILKGEWKKIMTPDVFKKLASLNDKRPTRPAASGSAKSTVKAERDPAYMAGRLAFELLIASLRNMPSSMYGTFTDDSRKFWFTVKDGSLLRDYTDAALKFGSQIPGNWSALAIVDALENTPSTLFEGVQAVADEVKENRRLTFTSGIDHLSAMSRSVIGRPDDMVAITPIAIYRNLDVL